MARSSPSVMPFNKTNSTKYTATASTTAGTIDMILDSVSRYIP